MASSQLFLSHVRPHAPVSCKTLARWMTTILALGGVDTQSFTAHSKSAGATHLRARGLTHRQICKLADWSLCTATFKKFYDSYL